MTWLFLLAGHLSLALGILGMALPVLPTTPFLLLALCCYSRSSPAFANWLTNHPTLGPPINDWSAGQCIRPKAKVLAILTLWLSLAFPIVFVPQPDVLRIALAVLGLALSAFLLSRPNAPMARHDPTNNSTDATLQSPKNDCE